MNPRHAATLAHPDSANAAEILVSSAG